MINAQNSPVIKIVSIVVLVSVLILFFTIPVVMFGGIVESSANQTADTLDSVDGSNDFTPGEKANQTAGQKVIDAFDRSGSGGS